MTAGIWLAIYDFVANEINVNYYTNKTLPYTNWNAGEPNKITDYCVRYDKGSQKWADRSCNQFYSVLCEIGTTEVCSTIYTDGTTHTICSSSLVTKTDINIMNAALWNKWNPWSFCQLYRQRNIRNTIKYQILNVLCGLICKYNY